jgi:hypothetical protein
MFFISVKIDVFELFIRKVCGDVCRF